VNAANPAFAALRAALDRSDSPQSEIEVNGIRWLVERDPEPGVEVRLTSMGLPPVASSQHFYATTLKPPGYPAWLPFVPGRAVSVSVWGSPECGSVAWYSLRDPGKLLDDLLEVMERDGWPPEDNGAPLGEEVAFINLQHGSRNRVIVSSGVGGEWVVVLSDYPATSGERPK